MKRRSFKALLFVFIILVMCILSYYAQPYFDLETIKANKTVLLEFVQTHLFISILSFALFNFLFMNSPLPFAAVSKILSGFLFGLWIGFIVNIIVTTLACLIGFFISRYFLFDFFHRRFGKTVRKIDKEIEENGFSYFLSARIFMVIPYFLINYSAGISKVRLRVYALTTFIGVIPSSFVYAFTGTSLEQISSVYELFSPGLLAAFILLGILILLPAVYNHFRKPLHA